jgi:isoleucyl-tRNA synthetase
MTFDVISGRLKKVWKDTYAGKEEEKQLQRGMVLNRGWGDSPGSSCELLGGWEESVGGRRKTGDGVMGAEHGQGNTELFGFPGMIFEVLKNGTVSCLTVY